MISEDKARKCMKQGVRHKQLIELENINKIIKECAAKGFSHTYVTTISEETIAVLQKKGYTVQPPNTIRELIPKSELREILAEGMPETRYKISW